MTTITRPADVLITLCQLEEYYEKAHGDAAKRWRQTTGTDRTYWAGVIDAYEDIISDIQGFKEELGMWLKRLDGKK